jgi:hypothetical protein
MISLKGLLSFRNQIKHRSLPFRGEIRESQDLDIITMSGRDLQRIDPQNGTATFEPTNRLRGRKESSDR